MVLIEGDLTDVDRNQNWIGNLALVIVESNNSASHRHVYAVNFVVVVSVIDSSGSAHDVDDKGIPFASINAVFVSTVEFAFGLLLILGALTAVACVMLGGLMIVAIATSAIKNIKAPLILDWLSEFLYLPEVLYLVILFWLFLAGPGWFSIDYLILSK